jgi:hypothetical protein
MPDYVTIAAKIGATGAPLTACEPEARAIYRPDLGLDSGAKEVTPARTTH